MMRFTILLGAVFLAGQGLTSAADSTGVSPIDLATALRLAGAKNLEVQIAREKTTEARGNFESTRAQFFPWISPGVSYRGHNGAIQDVAGNVFDANKSAYSVGGTISAQWDLGDAWFKTLAAKQNLEASREAFDAQRQESIAAAAAAYFELSKARALAGVAREGQKIAEDYAQQLERAHQIGLAFKGDALRVSVQAERNRLQTRQAEEQQRLAAARLAQVLHLDPTVDLLPQEADLAPLNTFATNQALDTLVAQATTQRPEFKQSDALVASAKSSLDGVRYGPWIPTVGGQVFLGGLGGGHSGGTDHFGDSEDYFIGLGWRLGPGGILDSTRIKSSKARLEITRLYREKLTDEITRQVVEGLTRVRSLADQLDTAKRALAAAEETWKLSQARKEYAVGIVLENLQAQQELTRARGDYVSLIADYNKAQYLLARATGALH